MAVEEFPAYGSVLLRLASRLTLGPFAFVTGDAVRIGRPGRFRLALRVTTEVGPYHPAVLRRSGVWSLRILPTISDLFVRVPTLSSVIHIVSNLQYLFDSFPGSVLSFTNNLRDLLELCKIAFLLRGKKLEMVKKRNHVLQNRSKVVDLVVPHSVLTLPHCAASQMAFEERQNDWITL